MSLLMQALRKAERTRGEQGHEEFDFGHDDAWRLEPLDATDEPGAIPAQEARHDPVPPQARHEAVQQQAVGPSEPPLAARPGGPRQSTAATGSAAAVPPPRAGASPSRIGVLLAVVALLAATFGFIYWRAVSAPGPGARLPMVPMPGANGQPVQAEGLAASPAAAAAAAAAAGVAGAATPVAADAGAAAPEAVGAAAAAAAAGQAGQAAQPGAAPATRPVQTVIEPTLEQLAAISDPAIRAEAMRDANERAARQVTADQTAPNAAAAAAGDTLANASPAPGTAPAGASGYAPQMEGAARPPTARPSADSRADTHGGAGAAVAGAGGSAGARATDGAGAGSSPAGGSGRPVPMDALPTAVGDTGDVRFVRSKAAPSIAPAVQSGYAALKAGDAAAARQQYDLALLQDPNNRDALLGSAAVALRESNHQQASANYLRLLELDPHDPDALAGLAALRPGDLAASEIRLKGIAARHGDSGAVHFALGNLYARQGRWADAQQSYFRAFSAMPDNADYAFNLAVGLDRMNQGRLAQTYYRRALELAQAGAPAFDAGAVRKRLQELETPIQ